ncbi:MAG: Uma2 family endonuclease [Actinomycetota bacterium]|nr:Uma2 family endonuclease [Actinomycetota bacterium]
MKTVVLGEHQEMTALIERRRALGQDRYDEVWNGVYVMAPFAHSNHGLLKSRLLYALEPRARRVGLLAGDSFNLGEPDDFRVPDAGYHRAVPGTLYVSTAALVLEVLSPDDETFEKFDFYAAHGVDELLVADPDTRTVRCWHLTDGAYDEQPASALLDVDLATLIAEVDWP